MTIITHETNEGHVGSGVCRGRVAPRVGRLTQKEGAATPRLDKNRIVGGEITTQGQFPSVVSDVMN